MNTKIFDEVLAKKPRTPKPKLAPPKLKSVAWHPAPSGRMRDGSPPPIAFMRDELKDALMNAPRGKWSELIASDAGSTSGSELRSQVANASHPQVREYWTAFRSMVEEGVK